MFARSSANAPRPRRRYDPHTRAGLIRSTVRQNRSATAMLGRWACRYVHSANSARGDVAIDAILIPDEVAWCLIPGKRLGQLACNPFSRRICFNVAPDELPPIQPDDDESIKQGA